MGKEAWFFVAYFVCGAGSAFVAGLIVWARPLWAARVLFGGGLLSSLIAGRYLWVGPVFIVLAFGLPGVMMLLAWTTSGIEQRGSSQERGERQASPRPTFTLATLFLLCAAIALALAHGRIARVPPYTPSFLMQEFSGTLLPVSVELMERLRREQRDAVYVLRQKYGIRIESTGGGSSVEGQHVELEASGTWHDSGPRKRSRMSVDLEEAMHALVGDRGMTIEHVGQSSGSLLSDRGMPDGFWIRYRSRHLEGLIQAGGRPGQQRVTIFIEERVRRNCLSIGESHYIPLLQDW
jgi:hypothetical protein